MRDVFAIARAHVITALREKDTLFWFLVFPLFLLTILTLIFGRLGQEQDIHFTITIINQEEATSGQPFSASALVSQIFSDLSIPPESGRPPLFTLRKPDPSQNAETYLESELSELRRGNRAAILVIPKGFDSKIMRSLSPASAENPERGALSLYMSETSVASETAASIIEQVLAELDRNLLSRMGHYDESNAHTLVTVWTGEEDTEIEYVDYVLPGIVLMGFFTSGLFSVPGTILFNRDRKVLRRYWVTPLSVSRYLLGFGVGHLALCSLQFALILALGRFAFGATISFASLDTVLLLILAVATFLAIGFLITSIARSANGGMATANILNMPMMFLSGMFFPLSGLPVFMMVLVYANPVTYVLEALRHSVGVQASTLMPWPWTLLVPLIWITGCSLVALRRLRWDVGR